jgi:hypothetical protein
MNQLRYASRSTEEDEIAKVPAEGITGEKLPRYVAWDDGDSEAIRKRLVFPLSTESVRCEQFHVVPIFG